MGGYCLVTRTSFESIFITELSSIDLLGFSFHFNKYDELINAIWDTGQANPGGGFAALFVAARVFCHRVASNSSTRSSRVDKGCGVPQNAISGRRAHRP
jgi:hypothetical protein